MNNNHPSINETLVQSLISTQFPQWKNFPIIPIVPGGWDNRTFRLGKDMVVRMPSAKRYANSIKKEQKWLPKLAPFLPLSIPQPLALGKPGKGYPYNWSTYRWLNGETVQQQLVNDYRKFAISLAEFLNALENIDSTSGPVPGKHNFYRGGSIKIYDSEIRKAISLLERKINTKAVIEIWEIALGTSWNKPPVWVHGDISVNNLLVNEGQLSAVIDFGQLAVGDPACDLTIAWTFLKGESRQAFRSILSLDSGTWARGCAWTLWKALIIASGLSKTNTSESKRCWLTINEVIKDYENT